MKKFKRPAYLLLIGFIFASPLLSRGVGQDLNLSEKTREFLKLAAYIILPQERDVLLKLASESHQEIFIESFWKQRDPTPGTPQNEYRDDILKRFQYANRFFGRGTTREGWQTDRGRVYIILGEPASKRDFSGRRGIYPCEVWYFYGDKEGLPTYFGLVFFKRKGTGDFRLYDPVSDGIFSLLMNTDDLSFDDYPTLYQRLRELVPDLAPVALSMIPGEIPYSFVPSPRDSILIADILESPKKDIHPTYATHFLDYRGLVSTEYMANFIENTACVDFLHDPSTGLTFVNFSIAPKSLSVDFYEPRNQHFCNLQLSVSLRQEETVIFQYTKDFPVYFSPEEADGIRSNGVSVEDFFPVIDGRYKLIVLLQNSVGKEFTIFEKDLEISEPGGPPHLSGLAVGYEIKDYDRDIFLPYKLLEKKLLIDPSHTFSPQESLSFVFSLSNITETLWKEGRIVISITGSKVKQPALKSLSIPLDAQSFAETSSHIQSVPAGELPPDYYVLSAALQDASGQSLDERRIPFIISPTVDVPHPLAQAKMVRVSSPAPFYLMMADQSEKMGRWEQAEAWYERAFTSNPEGRRGLIEYAKFLLKAGKPEKTIALIEAIKNEPTLRYDYFLAKGLAMMALGKTAEAVDYLLEGNKIYNSDTLLLNSLGFCYSQLGQKDKALAALRASLHLNPEQEDIKKLVAEIEK